jgi:shikimate 5-dehydrogenase
VQVVDGVAMFVGQAALQFELFTGERAPVALMEEVVLRSIGEPVGAQPMAVPAPH